jgi:hypothetical protein
VRHLSELLAQTVPISQVPTSQPEAEHDENDVAPGSQITGSLKELAGAGTASHSASVSESCVQPSAQVATS